MSMTFAGHGLVVGQGIAPSVVAAVSQSTAPIATLTVVARELRGAGTLRREVDLTLNRLGSGHALGTLFWDIDSPLDIPPFDTLDFAAVATLFLAMKHGARLHLRGAVTATMLRHLEELNEAWHQLLPDRYALVPIEADEVAADRPYTSRVTPRAALAFSGGLDSAFALARHLSGQAGRRTARIATGVLIHGFDIPLRATSAFAAARASAAAALGAYAIPLSIVRTNWREVAETAWEMDHMGAIAACLHQFAGACDLGLFGSDLTYAFNFWPWGSNPAIDHFLAGGRFGLRAEGQASKRTARAALVATLPALVDHLRVCWAGPMTGGNCGRCEKCVRTQLNFLAAGHDPGPAFPVRASLRDILLLNAPHPGAIDYLVDILEVAHRNSRTGLWRHVLAINLALNRALLPLRAVLGRRLSILSLLRQAFMVGPRLHAVGAPSGAAARGAPAAAGTESPPHR
jgi:hypothetical protein